MENNKFKKGIEIVGSAIIENNEGKILLTKSSKWHDKWTMPGGHIEFGETIEQALLREAEEETGLKLKSLGTIAFGELINSKDFHRPAHFIYFDILCKMEEVNSAIKLQDDELSECVWVSPEEALKMDLAESYDKTIRDYMEFKKTNNHKTH